MGGWEVESGLRVTFHCLIGSVVTGVVFLASCAQFEVLSLHLGWDLVSAEEP